jgi:ATP-dependent DNA helicase RecG
MGDLDNVLFDKAYTLIRNNRSDHPWLMVDKEQMLKDATLWRKDYQTGQEGLTLAAALIFGKDRTIQSLLPAYKVEAMVRKENKDRYDDRINPPLRTNLIDTYLSLKEFINKHLPEKFYTEGDQRIDLRDKIFREVIGNVIVHREYTSALSSEIIITETSVQITNPNKPLFHGMIDSTGFNPYPKNPNIRKFFSAFGWTDEIGSGIRNTNKYRTKSSGRDI